MDIRKMAMNRATWAFSGAVLSTGVAVLSCSGNTPSGGVGTTTGSGGGNQAGSGGSGPSAGNGGNGNTGGSSGGGATGGGSPTGAGGNITGAGGVVTGAGGAPSTGAGGSPQIVQKICAQKITAMNPLITNFETYNGMTDATQYVFAFGGAMPGTGNAYGGPQGISGVGTNTLLAFVAGPTSNWAMSFTATNETVWGGNLQFWMSCVNASAYRGISFSIRGQTPRGTFNLVVPMEDTSRPDMTNPAGGGTCPGANDDACRPPATADLAITQPEWTQYQITWNMFLPGNRNGTPVAPTGDNIAGLVFAAGMNWAPNSDAGDLDAGFHPVPADIIIQVDDINFIP